MRVMCSNDASKFYMELCQRYPANLGCLIGPRHWKNPRPEVAFALDNDAYGCWVNGTEYDFRAWAEFLQRVRASGLRPLWALVPDVVGNRERTLENWSMFYRVVVDDCRWTPALAVQDGMTREDVLALEFKPGVIFVGGTTEWKWKTAHLWCRDFPRVHIGRVRHGRLRYCHQIGAESCDGTGWFRESVGGKPARQLQAWLEYQRPHPELPLDFKL